MIQPVILCGGSGTRLWPLSRKAYPKQFVPLVSGSSLFQLTLERLAPLVLPPTPLLCVASADHKFIVGDMVGRALGQDNAMTVLEPFPRGTAAAMCLAALQAPDPGQLQLHCPSDIHIPDKSAFLEMVESAVPSAQAGAIVTFGVVPTHPSAAYGYIELGAAGPQGGHGVARFLEKPDTQRAEALICQGNVLWNSGMYLCKAGVLLAALELHAPDIVRSCRAAVARAARRNGFISPASSALADCPSASIDVAVMEKHRELVVYPFAGSWSDLGSWSAVADLHPRDGTGNAVEGQGFTVDAVDNYIHAGSRRVVALGTRNLIIIDTPDAVLVADRRSVEHVKNVVTELERLGSPEAVQHRKVVRPWGFFDSVEDGQRFKVKRLVVNPSAALSLQMHFHRAEHWVVVRGTAQVTRGKETFLLTENQATYIPLGEVHRLRNPGKTPLELIEVQSGDYLGEDDIVRFDDEYGREDLSTGRDELPAHEEQDK